VSGTFVPMASPVPEGETLVCEVCHAKGPAVPTVKAFYRVPAPWLGMLLRCAHGSLLFLVVCSDACARVYWDRMDDVRPARAQRMVH